jgi:membrane-associated phospholipid phosphatase
MRRIATLAVLAAALLPADAAAQNSRDDGLEYRASLDVPLTLAGVAGSIGPPLLTDPTRPWTCRWCDRDAAGMDSLNSLDAGARRRWRWSAPEKAHDWSNVALAASFAAPAGAFVVGRGGFGDGLGEEMLLVVESAAVTLALTQATKYLFRRERPWAHFADPPEGEHLRTREGALSFASGHASLSFAIAVSTGSLASLRGDDGKAWVWASGLTFAAATSYLRVAADRHYLTDVLAGAALGATVGWVVPRLVDRVPDPASPQPMARRRRESPVPLFSLALGAGRVGGPGSAVLVSGGMRGGGPFVSATWGF